MGHILFGAPSLQHYHLHDHLASALRSRGHRVTVLAADPLDFEFFSAMWCSPVVDRFVRQVR